MSVEAWPEVGFAGREVDVLVRVPGATTCVAAAIAAQFAPLETGGLVLGRYTARRSVLTVTCFLPPPPDSLHGRTDFVRGVAGLQEEVADARDVDPSVYAVGEWHTHPGGDPTPSRTDHAHMKRFAWRGLYGCRTPLLLIVGGGAGPNAPWSATLYRRWRLPNRLDRAW